MDKNKRFAEAAKVVWHKPDTTINMRDIEPYDEVRCICGHVCFAKDFFSHWKSNPDFTDAREVLLVMRENKNWRLFMYHIYNAVLEKHDGYDPVLYYTEEYILDTTGLLRDEAIKWMKEHK